MKIKNQKYIWNKIANSWNDRRKIPPKFVQDFLKDKSGNILDLGCGSGRNCIKIGPEKKYFCIDFSKKMLKLAKKNLKEKKIECNICFSKSWEIPFPNNFFDNTICIAVLHCIESKENRIKTIKEMNRTLKINGNILISVWSKNSPALKNKNKESEISWKIKDNNIVNRFNYIYELDEIKKEIIENGLKILDIYEDENIVIIAKKITS